jgi:hypothetical protein
MNKKYIFLDNKPTGEDLFEGKSQEKTALVLCDIIKNNKFQVIGIDGGWGVGKSNLVKIVEKDLKNDYEFFIYDVWGHQEDDQRRSLLIELTEFITNNERPLVTTGEQWDKKIKVLLSRKKEVTTENMPYLSLGFIVSLFSLIYSPAIVILRDEINKLGLENIFWKIAIVFAPWLIVLTIYIRYTIQLWDKKRKFKNNLLTSLQKTFQIYTNKQTAETKIESITEEEPSVRDFRKWMSDIDNDLKKKKLVIVLDNLDRLPKSHILSIWSSIHVFFSEIPYKNIKVIVPFDRKHIKSAFKDLNVEESKDYADDYINKTFDIVFRVSLPILTSWKSFLNDNWKKAFSEYSQDEYEKVEQAYEILRPTITPREIVAFINNFISRKLLGDTIPDRYIAIYILCEQTILDDPLKAIIELDYLKGLEPMYKGDEEYEKNITALAYQIDPKNALEVIYKKKLTNSLLNEDTDEFVEISKTNVFSRIITSVVSSLSDFRKPIIVLDQIRSYEQISSAKKKAIWQTVFSKVKDLESEENEIEKYQLFLLKNLQESNRKKYLNLLIKLISKESDDFDLGLYIENIDKLESFCLSEKLEVSPFTFLKEKQVDPESLKYAIDVKNSEYEKYELNYDLGEVDNYLSSIKVKDLEGNSFVKFLKEAKELEGFRLNLYSLLEANKNNLIYTISILNNLKICSEQRLNVSSVLTDGDIHTLVSGIPNNDDLLEDLAALRIMLLSNSSSSYSPTFSKYLINDSEDFHYSVAKEVEWYIQIDDLLVGSIKFTNPLIKGVINQLLKLEPDHRILNVNIILENLSSICQVNSLEPESILKMIDNSKIYDLDLDKIYKLNSGILDILLISESQIARKVISIFKENLSDYSKEQWEKEFKDIDSQLFKQLQAIDYNQWNTFAVEEFNILLLRIADKDVINNPDTISWIIYSMERNDRDLQYEFFNLRDLFISNNKMTAQKFGILIEPLIKHAKLSQKSDDVIRTMFKNEFLDNQSNIDLMIKHSEFLKDLLEKSGSSKSRFREALSARIQNEKIQNLSKALGFKIKDQNKDENQD